MGKWYTCNDCGKNLSSYHSHWRHQKTCPSKSKRAAAAAAPVATTPFQDTSIQTCSLFPDITKPVLNPKLSAMIDVIINNGKPSTPASSSEALPIPSASKRMSPAKSPPPAKKMKIIPTSSNLNYSQMIGPSSDEESVSERSMSPPKKRRLFEPSSDEESVSERSMSPPKK